MHRFEIWAPRAKKMSVRINERTLAMEGSDGEGWWQLSVDDAAAGGNYGFLIDDDTKCSPDPRSIWQPGV